MGAVVAANIVVAYRFRPLFRPASQEQVNLDRYRDVVDPLRRWLVVAIAVVLGLFAGGSGSGQWRQFLMWRHRTPFGTEDPYFKKDVGFYVFDLPWLHYLVDFGLALTVLSLLAAAVVHYLFGGIRLQAKQDRLSGAAQVQISVLAGLFVLIKALDYWLDRYNLTTDSGGLFTGLGYTDKNAVLPSKTILTFIAIICAVLFFANVLPPDLDAAVGGPGAARALLDPARGDLAGHRAAVPGEALRAGQGGAVHRAQHRGDASGVRHSRHQGDAVRRQPHAERRPAEGRHAVAPGCAAARPGPRVRRVRAAPAGARLLQRRAGARRRPLQGRRHGARHGGRGPRARPERPARRAAQLGQRAHRLHARLRRGRGLRQPAGPRQPAGREQRRQAGVGGAGPAAQGRPDRHVRRRLPAADLLRREQPRLLDRRQGARRQEPRARPARGPGVELDDEHLRGQGRACRSAACSTS